MCLPLAIAARASRALVQGRPSDACSNQPRVLGLKKVSGFHPLRVLAQGASKHQDRPVENVAYSVSGSYFESCNCDPICPRPMVDGLRGGRSTHGICYGALAWLVEDGRIGDVDVSGLATALIVRYDDDEPGSPWTIVLHVDAAGDKSQRNALADVFLGRHGGPQVGVLPWVRRSRPRGRAPGPIGLVAQGEGYELRIGRGARKSDETSPFGSDGPAPHPVTTSRDTNWWQTSSRLTTILSPGSSGTTARSRAASTTPPSSSTTCPRTRGTALARSPSGSRRSR